MVAAFEDYSASQLFQLPYLNNNDLLLNFTIKSYYVLVNNTKLGL